MARAAKWLFYLLVLPSALVLSGWQGWLWWSWAIAPTQSSVLENSPESDDGISNANRSAASSENPEPTIQIDIPAGTAARQIGQDLESAGLINSTVAWNVWTRWQTLRDRQGGFLAGTYVISPTESMMAIANRIWLGDVAENSFTVPEGWAMADIAASLEAQGIMEASEFLQATQRVSGTKYTWLPVEVFESGGANLEGFLYPDTYQVTTEVTPEQLVEQMLDRFAQLALPIYDAQNSPYSLLEWVTLASIVEKETVVEEERPTIAGVFARRLEEGIPLGADPTVEYALGIRQTPENPLTFADVRADSPYNTYRYAGLPPGPISNPGLRSLEESLNPPDTEFLYFVARYDGTHVFSRTLAEHEAAQTAIRSEIDSQEESTSSSGDRPNTDSEPNTESEPSDEPFPESPIPGG
ncbi:MAG: endolytic transglycosylase MltG [Elainellaceae cyanobacterium]